MPPAVEGRDEGVPREREWDSCIEFAVEGRDDPEVVLLKLGSIWRIPAGE